MNNLALRSFRSSLFLWTTCALWSCGGSGDGTPSETEAAAGSDGDEASTTTTTEGSGAQTSTGAESSETQAGEGPGENTPPPTPKLISPADGATEVAIVSELCWEPVEDPDGDAVRYRVWVDGIELTQGKLDEAGYEGPCIGPLDFNHERTYAWTVSAFEVENPEHESAQAELFTFETIHDGVSSGVFEDDFEEESDWEISGDALTGHWVRGNPVPVSIGERTAQPGDCAGGRSCFFTGQNPQGEPRNADVDGGAVVLTSPEFDLSGFAAATVELERFFFKSRAEETGTLFRVELLTPDASAPDGYQVHVLEQLEAPDDVADANAWNPVEYAACGIPLVSGSRLRIVAADLGRGVTEAAIDSVRVRGQFQDRVCSDGVGALCDPSSENACAEGLLCCPQGTVNKGVNRCAEPVRSLTYPGPHPNGEGFDGPLGCDAPDLQVSDEIGACLDTITVSDQPGGPNYCSLLEQCVGGPGQRRILRFETNTPNIGSRDLTMGVPSNHPDLFHYSECHEHYHFDNYAEYALLDGEGNAAATGHKQAFCLLDSRSWAWNLPSWAGSYDCGNQGISVGWQDEYYVGLDCQWIDVTDVDDDAYTLRIAVNVPVGEHGQPTLNERDYTNNVTEVEVDLANVPNCD